jgi:uncharacterized membrane protein HdeD (DUF308 family)
MGRPQPSAPGSRTLLTLVTLVGVWAIFHGVSEIFAAFSLRQGSQRMEELIA